jgi:hypothetical protein
MLCIGYFLSSGTEIPSYLRRAFKWVQNKFSKTNVNPFQKELENEINKTLANLDLPIDVKIDDKLTFDPIAFTKKHYRSILAFFLHRKNRYQNDKSFIKNVLKELRTLDKTPEFDLDYDDLINFMLDKNIF